MNTINPYPKYDEQFKVRVNTNTSIKHELVKCLIVKLIREKYKRNSNWIRVYSEWKITEGKICDIYFENLKTNECYAFEVQKQFTPQWFEQTQRIYDDWEVYLFKTNWIPINLNELSDKIPKLTKQINQFIP